MNGQGAFDRILASLYDAMLDDALWPGTSALIDEACGLTGNDLMVGEGPQDDVRVLFVGAYCRGQRREDQERDYLENYHPTDERVPRFRHRPDSRLVHVNDLLTAEELKTSPTYNVTALLPHIRQFVRVRQALVRAGAQTSLVTGLLDNPRIGVVHLDRRGRIVAVNDRGRRILRGGDGVSDRNGALRARAPDDELRLQRLLAAALPTSGAVPVGGSMLLGHAAKLSSFVAHVKPVGVPQPDYGARHVAALVLIVEPRRRRRVDPALVETTLKLTQAESQVAVWLAEGRTAREMAEATGLTRGAIYSRAAIRSPNSFL